MADLQNIRFNDLLGENFSEKNYAVSSNWRINFEVCKEFVDLVGNADVAKHMSYACTSDYDFEATTEFANANIKGIPISQAVWQHREFDGVQITILEPMDRSVENALLRAQNKGTGYFNDRNVAEKKVYTFSGIQLIELGNDGQTNNDNIVILDGLQIQGVKLGTFTSGDSANIVGTQLTVKGHGWHKPFEA
jgi:hypothetical protein